MKEAINTGFDKPVSIICMHFVLSGYREITTIGYETIVTHPPCQEQLG